MHDIWILIAGLALILAGAEALVNGASAVARRFGLSDFLVGMTIMAIGTSAPEMAVSFLSAARGSAGMAAGNVVGSNIFNTLVILGLTAVISPVPLTRENIRRDIPFSLLAAFILCVMGMNRYWEHLPESLISRTDGIFLLLLFLLFMFYSFREARKTAGSAPQESLQGMRTSVSPLSAETVLPEDNPKDSRENRQKNHRGNDPENRSQNSPGTGHGKTGRMWVSLLMIAGGLAALLYGGDLFVDSAGAIARKMGVSEAVIAITLMAGGTSLPELASSIVAACKKKTGMALGNVLGSNIANILLVLGGSALIRPLHMEGIGVPDLGTLLLSALLVFVTAFTFRKKQVDRPEGIIFLLLYAGFLFLRLR